MENVERTTENQGEEIKIVTMGKNGAKENVEHPQEKQNGNGKKEWDGARKGKGEELITMIYCSNHKLKKKKGDNSVLAAWMIIIFNWEYQEIIEMRLIW